MLFELHSGSLHLSLYWATRMLIFAVSAPCLCPLSLPLVSAPCFYPLPPCLFIQPLNWSRFVCVNPLLSLGYGFGDVMNLPKE
jgi:hypothetical protein